MNDNMPIGLAMAVGLEIWFLNIHISKWIFLSGRVESELHQAIQEAEKELETIEKELKDKMLEIHIEK